MGVSGGDFMAWEERCSVCGNKTSVEVSDSVFRLIKDRWVPRYGWEEVIVICEKCFCDMFLSGLRFRGVEQICKREDLEV